MTIKRVEFKWGNTPAEQAEAKAKAYALVKTLEDSGAPSVHCWHNPAARYYQVEYET